MNANLQNNWQAEIGFRLDLLRLAAAADQRTTEELEQAEVLMELARRTGRSGGNE